jgi:hypothetical protein
MLPLCLISWARECKYSVSVLVPALDGGEWWAWRPYNFTSEEGAPYPPDKWLGEPQIRSGRSAEENSNAHYAGKGNQAISFSHNVLLLTGCCLLVPSCGRFLRWYFRKSTASKCKRLVGETQKKLISEDQLRRRIILKCICDNGYNV